MSLNTVSLAGRLVRFPSPLEVDRDLYFDCPGIEIEEVEWFSAPREVDREIYRNTMKDLWGLIKKFSAPFEVDREIYR